MPAKGALLPTDDGED